MDDKLLEELVELFDDTDITVSQCVDRQLASMGYGAVTALGKLYSKENDPEKRRLIDSRRRKLNTALRLADLQKLAANRMDGFSLFEAVFTISSLLDCGLRRNSFQDAFFDCARAFAGEIPASGAGYGNISVFNHIFFRKLGFKVNDTAFRNAASADMFKALTTKKGNPFTIALLYFLFAEEQQLPLYPLCIVGGFVPACIENGKEIFYIDLFDEGRQISSGELESRLKREGSGNTGILRNQSVLPGIWMESLCEVFSRCGDSTKFELTTKALTVWGEERFLDRKDGLEE